MLASLYYSDFRLLWLSSLFAGAANWALIVSRGWLVYSISGSSMWVGVVTFAAMSPNFLAPHIAGFLADRFDRKKLLSIVFLVQFAHNIVLAGLAIMDVIEVSHLVILSFLNGCARASQMPAAQALLPNLIPPQHLLNAISLNAATVQGSRLVGPAAIVPLMAIFGPEGAFVICTIFYLFSLTFSMNIKTVSFGQLDNRVNFVENFLAGLKFVYGHRLILPLVVTVFLHCCLTMSFESILPVLAEEFFKDGGLGATYLMMAVGTGALIFVLCVAVIRDMKKRGNFLFTAAALSGLGPIILGIADNSVIALVGCFLMGAAQASFMAIAGAVVQTSSPDAIRGRVMSVYLWHIGGMMATFNWINAAITDSFGPSPVLIISGTAFMRIEIISLFSVPLRSLYFRGRVE